jgi:hypothetical protein
MHVSNKANPLVYTQAAPLTCQMLSTMGKRPLTPLLKGCDRSQINIRIEQKKMNDIALTHHIYM